MVGRGPICRGDGGDGGDTGATYCPIRCTPPHPRSAQLSLVAVVKQFLLLCPAAATINYPPLCIFAGLTLPDHCFVRVSQHNNYVGKSAHVDGGVLRGRRVSINESNTSFYLLDRLAPPPRYSVQVWSVVAGAAGLHEAK
jgi:hypothetical protein